MGYMKLKQLLSNMAQSSRVAINAAFVKLMMLTLLRLYFIVFNNGGQILPRFFRREEFNEKPPKTTA